MTSDPAAPAGNQQRKTKVFVSYSRRTWPLPIVSNQALKTRASSR
jgi:hypothetical protein